MFEFGYCVHCSLCIFLHVCISLRKLCIHCSCTAHSLSASAPASGRLSCVRINATMRLDARVKQFRVCDVTLWELRTIVLKYYTYMYMHKLTGRAAALAFLSQTQDAWSPAVVAAGQFLVHKLDAGDRVLRMASPRRSREHGCASCG